MKKNLVVCPVYNEQETIGLFYQNLRKHYHQDVLFIDDGSIDESRDFVVAVKDKDTFVIQHPSRYGYGAALLSGFGFALQRDYERIITIDVDLQHDPIHISAFFRALLECEVVLGSRYISIDKYLDVPRTRLLINRYIANLLKVLLRRALIAI